MSDDDGDRKMEYLLRQMKLEEPSERFSRRMEILLRSMRPRWIGPLSGFAAGVAATIAISLVRTQVLENRQSPVPQSIVQVVPPKPAEENKAPLKLTMWAEPHETVDRINGVIEGVPVQLERTRRQTVLWKSTGSTAQGPAAIVLPEVVTLRQVVRY